MTLCTYTYLHESACVCIDGCMWVVCGVDTWMLRYLCISVCDWESKRERERENGGSCECEE